MYICNALNDRFFERLFIADSFYVLLLFYSKMHKTHGKKSGLVTGLVREAHPVGSYFSGDELESMIVFCL